MSAIPQITLAELAYQVEGTINKAYYNKSFWVVAETSDVKNYPDRGYCFLTLVEKEGRETLARMEAVIWSRNYHIIREFELATGTRFEKNIRLLLKVALDFSPQYGLKLVIEDVDASFTMGNMELEKQAILNRLLTDHPEYIKCVDGEYITYNKLLHRPLVMQHIALITAPDSDGRRDFLHELEHNEFGYAFDVDEYLSQIQGKGAMESIINQLDHINLEEKEYDAVVIVRGGGAQLDFGPFDTYEMGLMVATFPYPVITGIGHERNVSITDMMCHVSVKTPTKAASFLIDHNRDFEEDVIRKTSYSLSKAEYRFRDALANLDRLESKLVYSGERYLNRRNHEIDRLGIAIRHLDPVNTLNRGFAMIMKENKIVTNTDEIKPGDELDIRLRQNLIQAQVQSLKKIK